MTTDNDNLTVRDLRCEYLEDPIGIDHSRPRLGWKLTSARRGASQTAYQIRVFLLNASTGPVPVWDTGKVVSDRSTHVEYDGLELKSALRYSWQVRVWDENGRSSDWSAHAYWEIGLLDPTDWMADWISPGWDEDTGTSHPAPMLRRPFRLDGNVRSARLYITALGLYEAFLNGERVGDALFTPGWTSYNERLQYQVYDVTHLLHSGENAFGALLGDGWYRGRLTWESRRNVYGERLTLLAQLHVDYEDGASETICTDDKWRAATGPILMSDIYEGETYDARLERSGWATAQFEDRDWGSVRVMSYPRDLLVAQIGPPVKRIEEVRPVGIHKGQRETAIVDFGQNMVGWVRLRVSGEAGQTVVLRHAEILDPRGAFYTDNLRTAAQEVHYTLKGGGEEVFEPHFTFQGFRYVSVEGFPGELSLDSLTGIVLHSDVRRIGRFSCSNAAVNQLYSNIIWSQKGNFLDIPTDCPQRDERLGWTGDAQVFAETAAFNMDVAAFFTKWLADLRVDQRDDGSVPHVIPDVISSIEGFRGGATGWADAAVIVPWILYRMYGDTRILENQFESMANWIAYMRRRAGDDLIWRGDEHFGDWLSFRSNDHRRPSGPTDTDLLATAYFAYSTKLVAESARILGRVADATVYSALAARIQEAYVAEFVTPRGRMASNTQTAYVLALAFDLIPEDLRESASERLVEEIRRFDNHLTTGFLGTPLLLHVLSNIGRTDVAYDLLVQDTYPSWLYPVTQGATTIWEHWDGIKPDGSLQDPGMNSYNHYAYGAVGSWLYQLVGGIRLDDAEPAFRHVIIDPRPGGGLTWAEATLDTMYGLVHSSWKVVDGRFHLEVTIPPNARGTVLLPASTADAVTESGVPLGQVTTVAVEPTQRGGFRVEVPSGSFTFECPVTSD